MFALVAASFAVKIIINLFVAGYAI